MQISTETIHLKTNGFTHILDITPEVQTLVQKSLLKEGSVLISAIGSTTGITTLEYEPGLVDHDVSELFEQIAPYNNPYTHNATWEMTMDPPI